MSHVGMVADADRSLLLDAWRDTMRIVPESSRPASDQPSIFWINIWQFSDRDGGLGIARADELGRWARRTAEAHYGPETRLDGYGLAINPAGSAAQSWHIDYALDYSTIFIPLTELSPLNAPQYFAFSDAFPEETYTRAIADLDKVDIRHLTQGGSAVIRQLLSPRFSLLKLHYGAIHRGIANKSGVERVLFWLSVRRSDELLPVEPPMEIFHKDHPALA